MSAGICDLILFILQLVSKILYKLLIRASVSLTHTFSNAVTESQEKVHRQLA